MKYNEKAVLSTKNIRDRRRPPQRTTTRTTVQPIGRATGQGVVAPLGRANPEDRPVLSPFADVAALTGLREALGGLGGVTPPGRFSEGLSVNPERNGRGLSPLALYRQALDTHRRATPAPAASKGGLPGAARAVAGLSGQQVDLGGDTLGRLMKAIRTKESGGNYRAVGIPTKYGRASGAYQFLDSTWGNYKGYRRAADAPPAVQDERARQMMGEYLQRFGDPGKVAQAWYAGPASIGRANTGRSQNGGQMPSISKYVSSVLALMR